MPYKTTIVVTTINDMPALDGYVEAAKQYDSETNIIVIPDKKTPKELYERVLRLKKTVSNDQICLLCPSIQEQDAFLEKIGAPEDLIPYNSDNRRNIGFLLALTGDSDFVISMDDDNHIIDPATFIPEHSIVAKGRKKTGLLSSRSGWYNNCQQLKYEGTSQIFPRGLPYKCRIASDYQIIPEQDAEVHINAGLWLGDPDVDAISRLNSSISMDDLLSDESITLCSNSWCPINTQNTAINISALPAYYYIRMGDPVAGLPIDRYGDIFSGYFIQACAKHLNKHVRFGLPLAMHKRNTHDLLKDLTNELSGILMLEDMSEWITEVKLSGSNYIDAYESLCHQIADASTKWPGWIWQNGAKEFIQITSRRMLDWIRLCRSITS